MTLRGLTGFRSQFRRSSILPALLLVVVAATGCGSSAHVAKTYPVKGKVTLNGKPVSNGSVMFVSTLPDIPPSIGSLTADGTYSLKTYVLNDGAPAGEYKVAIVAYEDKGPPKDTDTASPKPLVPKQYLTIDTTPLHQTVREIGVNEINIEL